MSNFLFKGTLKHSYKQIEGNLIVSKQGTHYIIPILSIEDDGHHILIDSDDPFCVDENSIELIVKQ